MQIKIDTAEEISDLDRQVLALLAGVEVGEEDDEDDEVYVGTDEVGEDVYEPEEKPEPAKKAAAKKAEPTPEPMAEEPVEEEPEEEPEDDMSDEDLLALAIKKATEMVAGGDAAKVREALDVAGASRVRELNADNVRDFFGALS